MKLLGYIGSHFRVGTTCSIWSGNRRCIVTSALGISRYALKQTLLSLPLFVSVPEVRCSRSQGAGGVAVSSVLAFLRREVWPGHRRSHPQAVWLPQGPGWAPWGDRSEMRSEGSRCFHQWKWEQYTVNGLTSFILEFHDVTTSLQAAGYVRSWAYIHISAIQLFTCITKSCNVCILCIYFFA